MSVIEDIKELKIQGASKIAKAAIKDLNAYGADSNAKDKKGFIEDISMHAKALKEARPTEPELQNVLEKIIGQLRKSDASDITKLKKILFTLCKQEVLEIKTNMNKIEEYGASLIPKNSIILTHCHSHNVVNILRKVDPVKVYTTETRPLFQGRLTAKDLSSSGITTESILDDEAADVIEHVDCVIIGADAITRDGVVNKVGSRMIAILADKYRKPLYVAASTLKIIERIDIEDRDRKEVWEDAPDDVEILNHAFDLVPFGYVKKIITEKGILMPKDIKF